MNSRVGVLGRWLPLLAPGFALFLLGLVVLANSGEVSRQLLSVVRAVPGGDKTVHFLLAGTMTLLLNWRWRAAHWRLGPLPIQKGSLLVAFVCTLEELSQLYIRARSFDLEDLASDYLGIAVLGQLGAWIYTRARSSERSARDSGDGR